LWRTWAIVVRNDEWLRPQMAAMTGAAGYGRLGVGHLGHVVDIDVLGHFVHQASGRLFFLGVIGKVEPRTSVRADVLRVGRVAGAAMRAEGTFPLLHDLVHLLAGQILGQHFEIGGCGIGARRARSARAGCCGEEVCGAWAKVVMQTALRSAAQ